MSREETAVEWNIKEGIEPLRGESIVKVYQPPRYFWGGSVRPRPYDGFIQSSFAPGIIPGLFLTTSMSIND